MKHLLAILAIVNAMAHAQTAVPAVQYDSPSIFTVFEENGKTREVVTHLWKCADTSRVLLTTENGKHICVLFPDEADANKPYNVGVINMGDSYGPRGGIDWIEAREFEERSAVLAKYPTAHLRTSTKQPKSRRYCIVVGTGPDARQIGQQKATAGEAWRSAWVRLKGAGR